MGLLDGEPGELKAGLDDVEVLLEVAGPVAADFRRVVVALVADLVVHVLLPHVHLRSEERLWGTHLSLRSNCTLVGKGGLVKMSKNVAKLQTRRVASYVV